MAGEIFISYRRADQAKARLLHALLKQRGVDAWYDALLDAGADWRHKTAEALEKAPIFVLLFSKVASESDDISKELAAATFSKKLVVPVRIENIKPSGAFLYELASRNWVDAYEDTEANFAELADKLAALVKGGPEAEVAAFSLGAPAAPVVKPAPKPLLKQPLVLGGIAVAVVALAAVVAMMMLGPKPPSARDQRIAFFGLTPADADALSIQVAGVATDEIYATLNAIGLETAAPGDTQGIELKAQIDTAAKLGARYALSGGARTSDDKVTVTIRLDDVQTRAMLWRRTLTGGAKQSESLPVQAAARTTNLLRCLITIRPVMAREDAAAMGLVTRACDTDAFDPELLTRWREVVGVAPKSHVAEATTGVAWILQSVGATPDDRRAMLQQARLAFARAQAIDPASLPARAGLDLADIASDRPLAKIVEDLNAMLGVSVDRSERRNISTVTFVRLTLMTTVGRSAEAARLGRSDVAADPLNSGLQAFYAGALYASGQVGEGRIVGEMLNRRFAEPGNWSNLAFSVIFTGGDLASIVAAAPPSVSPQMIACIQDLATAARASDANAKKVGVQRMQECSRTGTFPIDPAGVGSAIAGLGDAGTAIDMFGRSLDRSNPVTFLGTGPILFMPHVKALRADPRFLPLVKKAGIYQYWLDTKTQPDVCETPEEREIEVCRELRKDKAKLGQP